MSISNNDIFQRLRQLGLNPPTINDNNKMFGLALIYNAEMEQDIQDDQVASDHDETDHEYSLYKDPRPK